MGGFSGYTRVDYDGVGGGVDPMEEAVLFAMYLYDQAWTSAPGARKEKPLAPKTILDYVSRVGVQLQLHGEGEFLEFTFLYKRLAAQLRAEPRDGNWKSPASILMVREIVTNGLLSMGIRVTVAVVWQFTWRLGQATSTWTEKFNGDRTIRRKDVQFEWANGKRVAVRIKSRGSKSDKFNTGNVKWLTVAAEDCLCPVELFCEYWDATADFDDESPLFRHYDGKLVTYRQVVAAIKQQAVAMGLDPKHFAGHSLRIGGSTAMTAADLSMYDKMQQGGWQSLEASLCYMRRSEAMEQRVVKALQLPKRRPLGVLGTDGNRCPLMFYARPRFGDRL